MEEGEGVQLKLLKEKLENENHSRLQREAVISKLEEKLEHENNSRLQHEAVNTKLMSEQELLRKKLAEAELHIDKLRFGVNVDIYKRYILNHETRQCTTLLQKLEVLGQSTYNDGEGSSPDSPTHSAEENKQRDNVNTSKKINISIQNESYLHLLQTSAQMSQTTTTEHEECFQPLASPNYSEDKIDEIPNTHNYTDRSNKLSLTLSQPLFGPHSSLMKKEGGSSMFFSDILTPNRFSCETSVTEQYYNSGTSSFPPSQFSDTATDSSILHKKDVSLIKQDERARIEGRFLSHIFRIHSLLEKVALLKQKDDHNCTVEELSDGIEEIVFDHEKLVSEITKPDLGHSGYVPDENKEALEDGVSVNNSNIHTIKMPNI